MFSFFCLGELLGS